MHVLSRPKLATGIALAGAAAIAMSPVTVSQPDIAERVTAAAPAVQLTAIDNPFPLWEAITQQALGSLQALVEDYLSNPAPILTQIANNQTRSISELAGLGTTYVASLGTAAWNLPADALELLADLQAGNVNAALDKLVATVRYPAELTAWLAREAFPILVRPIDRAIGLFAALPAVISPMVDAIMTAASTYIMSVAGTVDDVWQGMKALDFDRTVNALLTGLAVIPATALGLAAAPLQGWIGASRMIAKVLADIDPPPGLPTGAPAGLPDPGASSLMLDVEPEDVEPDVTVQRSAPDTDVQTVSTTVESEVESDVEKVDAAVDSEGDDEEPAEREKVRTGLAFKPGSASPVNDGEAVDSDDDAAVDDTTTVDTVADDTAADDTAGGDESGGDAAGGDESGDD
ncbi:hypothetical protein H7J88_06300 [Mycolicibacterium flavescens]|uniref:PE-PGRS family protein n=1 Tax=Mycolicibacterium flavescens TaxID=1776 RepID=A0A1E3RH01_MYCFV|nr:hypothetical protein [Mycolicibacterium flavescens]MCV7279255.1 hypothetical protein [Mycolicibacterium flavescens]ODQ89109.1 hypothetical protein BHQ18_16050 [Mycolicibacterium flavescens]